MRDDLFIVWVNYSLRSYEKNSGTPNFAISIPINKVGIPTVVIGLPANKFVTPNVAIGIPTKKFGTLNAVIGAPMNKFGTPNVAIGMPKKKIGTPKLLKALFLPLFAWIWTSRGFGISDIRLHDFRFPIGF